MPQYLLLNTWLKTKNTSEAVVIAANFAKVLFFQCLKLCRVYSYIGLLEAEVAPKV